MWDGAQYCCYIIPIFSHCQSLEEGEPVLDLSCDILLIDLFLRVCSGSCKQENIFNIFLHHVCVVAAKIRKTFSGTTETKRHTVKILYIYEAVKWTNTLLLHCTTLRHRQFLVDEDPGLDLYCDLLQIDVLFRSVVRQK